MVLPIFGVYVVACLFVQAPNFLKKYLHISFLSF